MMWLEREEQEILSDEGVRLKAYQDDVGVWTIGVGHTGNVKAGDKITMEQARTYLSQDIEEAVDDAKYLCPDWAFMSEPRKGVMVNMAFNLGRDRLGGFKNTLKYIANREYAKAATNMLLSKWAQQVGQRANRLAHRMEHNTYAAR